MHAVQRPYEFHAFKVLTAELWHHRLQLGTVEHPHERRFDDIIEMVTQRDLIATQFPCLLIECAAPHACAKVTRGTLTALFFDHLEDLLFKELHRQSEQSCIFLNSVAVLRPVSRIHHKVLEGKRNVTVSLQHLQQFGHQHGILPAGNARADPVVFLDQLIAFERSNKGHPELSPHCPRDAPLDLILKRCIPLSG